jgi:signal transduction histidine kinase/CheY-like chemotaxis protein/PAS domain-containing protein
MTERQIQLQVMYETAMAIGNSLDLEKMLMESLNVYLRKFNLAAGAVLENRPVENRVHIEPLFSIPRRIDNNSTFQGALSAIPSQLSAEQHGEFIGGLPISGICDSMQYHIMELPDFGLLVLLKSGAPLDEYLLKSMSRLNRKLAIACRSCLRQKAMGKLTTDLEQENKTRKEAETALAESHERLLTVLNSIDVMIFASDLKTHEMIFMNRHTETQLNVQREDQPCYEVVHGETRPCANCANDALLGPDGRPVGPLVWEDRNPLTRKWYFHQARAIKWIDGRWVRLQISTDITRLKKLEQERLQEAHLQQTRRLEALGILAGGAAHEYNNLLMSMLGNLSLMTFKIGSTHPANRHLKKIEESIRAAATLTDQLLGYAQKGRYDNIKLQLNSLIKTKTAEFSASHESIRMHSDLAEDLKFVEADQRQIEHVLYNLLSNAGDAMPDGGDLTISTRNIARRDLSHKPYILDKSEYVEIRVRDTGVGMSAEIRDHIFDPFYTTKPMVVGRGAGLGMAATYGIIKAHEGFIEVSSEEGKGSDFVVYLPSYAESDDQAATVEEPAAPAKRVLWVDDDKTSLEIGTQILEHLGYEVIEANSGMEAVARYRRAHDRIDVVVLDMVMPEMSGVETFEQIKSNYPEAKVLMASGYLLDAEARRLLEHGADGFVKKPFVIDEIHQTIERVTRGDSHKK